ncbi:MAG: hypothetical protein AB7N76_18655 [Planctomycetota bacterium]
MFATADSTPHRALSGLLLAALAAGAALTALGCKGDTGSPGVPGSVAPVATVTTALGRDQDLPGVVVEITAVSAGSGPGGNLNAGDVVSVTFKLRKKNGDPLGLDQLDSAGILLSGPTFNYQHVIPLQRDVLTKAVKNSDGSYTYTFPSAIPQKYPAPDNDTTAFGKEDGELQGEDLLAGTYTVGIQVYKNYSVLTETYRDAGVTTKDVLLGATTALQPREVVKNENCNQCHQEVRAHGGTRLDVRYCVLCHTSGAEDGNAASVEGGTPGRTIDFRVMIHKIHAGKHLPSVLGVGTKADGTRDYALTKKPYKLLGFQSSVLDYSEVGFPVFPNLNSPMPRDEGYTALAAAQRSLEDEMRRGPTACFKCHGDPDGSGPLSAPAQGTLVYSQPTRRACGSCHDDIDWAKSYVANGQTMAAQSTDKDCASCHLPNAAQAGTTALPSGVVDLKVLSVEDAHRHPTTDPKIDKGMVFALTDVKEAGTNNANGRLDSGEKVELTFTVKYADGTDVPVSDINQVSVGLAGPRWNQQALLVRSSLPSGALTNLSQPFKLNLMDDVLNEYVGDATGAAQSLKTTLDQHWASRGAATTVNEVTGLKAGGGSSTAVATSASLQNYVEVASTTNFAKGDVVVIDRALAAKKEYAKIALVDGVRLWFTYPLRNSHAAGATVEEVSVVKKTVTTDYTLDEPTGTINLLAGRFTATNAVIVDYTGDWKLPTVYQPPLNDSPDLGEAQGEWTGKALVSGTYVASVWGRRTVTVMSGDVKTPTETNTYRSTAKASQKTVVVIAPEATSPPPPSPVFTAETNCNRCHEDYIVFHGGSRRGLLTCLVCHGNSGAEDWARYEGGTGPVTKGLSIDFRVMLHKIHMGKELAFAASYEVAGFNGSSNKYNAVGYPVLPGGARQCASCHEGDTWKEPRRRDHPTAPSTPVLAWRAVCGSCHDSNGAGAHLDLMTFKAGQSGASESCEVCHGTGASENVGLVHKAR